MPDDKAFNWDDEDEKKDKPAAGGGFSWDDEEKTKASPEPYAEAKAKVSQPTQFEKERGATEQFPGHDKNLKSENLPVDKSRGFLPHVADWIKSQAPPEPKSFGEALSTGLHQGLKTLDPRESVGGQAVQTLTGTVPQEYFGARERGHDIPYSVAAGASSATGVRPLKMEQAAEHGDTGGVYGEAAGPTALAVAPSAISRIPKIPGAGPLLKTIGEPFHIGMSGEELLKKGVSPRAQATGWDDAISRPGVQRALAEHNSATPIKSAADLDEAIPLMKEKIWSEKVEPALARQAKRPVDMNPAAEAVRKAVTPEIEEFDPEHADQLNSLADKLEGSRDVQSANRLLTYVNGKLESYFAKYPSARRANLMNNPDVAGWESARRAIREQFLDTLENAGEKQIREARQDYGGLETVGKEVERRVNVADRAKPMSLSRLLGIMGAVPSGGVSVLAGEAAHYLNKPDVLIKRGISRLNPGPEAPFTPPASFEPPEGPKPTPVAGSDLRQQARNPQEGPTRLSPLRPVSGATSEALSPIEARGFAKAPPAGFQGLLKETGWQYGGKNAQGIHEFKEPKSNISISVKDADLNPRKVRERIVAKLKEFGR